MLSIGIDFGTSNSSVAVYDGQTVKLLELDTHAKDRRVMRSLLYIPRDGEIVAGQRALDLYTEQNTGREVKMERHSLGEITMTFSEMEVVKEAYAMVDVNEPGRLFQSLKRFLAMTSFKKTDVFGTEYSLEELVATLAQQILRAAEAALGSKISSLVVGRPVRFDDDDEKDQSALAKLKDAWGRVGVDEVRFMEEPVAAAHHHAAEARLVTGTRFLVFDFGGGTLDITVAEARGDSIDVLATGGVPIGGDLLDSRIMETRIAPQFGRGAHYEPEGLPVPSHILSRLRTWQTIVELNRPDRLEIIRDARRRSDSPRELAALESLVTRNHGLELFRAIERAKIALSDEEQAEVRLQADDIDLAEGITRDEFEAAIGAQVNSSRVCVLDAVRQAGLEPEEIALVITTGGSSLIPVFRNALREALPNAKLTAAGTFTSVAAGLALAGGTVK
ncbi:MAG: Hsp70 family protein [Chloroflexi bacterium]|nr:Hsp70 family protein [Chloroflexota bacterium]